MPPSTMGCKTSPSSNIALENGTLATMHPPMTAVSTLDSCRGKFQTISTVLKSAVLFIMFLVLYRINQQVHILPRFSDIDSMRLHNVSAWESIIFGEFAPHHFVSVHHTPLLDVLSTIPYSLHYFIPVLYPLYLYYHERITDISQVFWLMGCTMWIHYLIWFLLPTAPPWVYDNWSKFSDTTMPPFHLQHKEGCAFARLDTQTGIPFFFNRFASNPVPFASFPSGHVSWPMCIYLMWAPGGKLFIGYIVWMVWATLYACHHYLSDALCAIILVVTTKTLLLHLKEHRAKEQFWGRATTCFFFCLFILHQSCLTIIAGTANCPILGGLGSSLHLLWRELGSLACLRVTLPRTRNLHL